MSFHDRAHAGRLLAERLQGLHFNDPVVLAVPHGGLAVGAEIAPALHAELDVVLVRKLRHPLQSELAIGAVGEGASPILNERCCRGLDRHTVECEAARRAREVEDRLACYRAIRPAANLSGRDVILVDDGVATGATIEAAVEVVQRRRPGRVIVALPVAPPDCLDRLGELADEVVCLESPEDFGAVGQFYERFEQIDDEQACAMLRAATSGGT
ncbi:MAG: phosphoribosyltransferase [Phycisphaerales bacterium]|nr:phosphoribosyltransferase [Phycisphaerales bacterium]